VVVRTSKTVEPKPHIRGFFPFTLVLRLMQT
jgi:hypothetical protein